MMHQKICQITTKKSEQRRLSKVFIIHLKHLVYGKETSSKNYDLTEIFLSRREMNSIF